MKSAQPWKVLPVIWPVKHFMIIGESLDDEKDPLQDAQVRANLEMAPILLQELKRLHQAVQNPEDTMQLLAAISLAHSAILLAQGGPDEKS